MFRRFLKEKNEVNIIAYILDNSHISAILILYEKY